MLIVLQRVAKAAVRVDGEVVSGIGRGFCVLVGIGPDDTEADVSAAVSKIAGMRVFADENDKMNLSLDDVGGEVMVVSQFTLYGDVRRGRRPSFGGAAPPEAAEPLIDAMVQGFRRLGLRTAHGDFGAKMQVELVNDGPVTLILEVSDGVVA